MNGINNNFKIPFDQFQRYKKASEIIDSMRKNKSERYSILEIGANEHKNLEKFLPNDYISYLDIQLSDNLLQDAAYYLGDATNMLFEDSNFDIVIALDVFEHIKKNKRENFLNEVLRVTRKLFIIAGPFDSSYVRDAEIRLNEIFKIKYNQDYLWLKEHIENGLPDLSDIMSFYKDKIHLISSFPHGSIWLWEKMMRMHFEVANDVELQNYRLLVDEFYNKNIFTNDFDDINYREFVVGQKDQGCAIQLNHINKSNKSNKTVNGSYTHLNDIIESCLNLSQNRTINSNMVNEFHKIKEIEGKKEIVDLKKLTEKLKNEYSDLYNQLNEKADQLNSMSDQLNEKELLYLALHNDFVELLNSNSIKITAPIRKIRHYLKYIIKAFEIIKTDGLIELFSKVRGKYNCNNHSGYGFQEWIEMYDTMDNISRTKITSKISKLENKPLISVLLPVYNPPPKLLEQAILSVKNQLYKHWELCIADDGSTDLDIKKILDKHSLNDERIKVIYRIQNGHISEASNSALGLACGDFIALLDHDDVLSEDALYWVANEINEFPDVELIYSDEDKIDIKEKRFDPYFKCDWNYDLFLSHNMITHLGVYKTSIVKNIGGFRKGFEGAQDYDLALRFIEQIQSSNIKHIPRILYHWRVLEGSTALSCDEKPYAVIAGKNAINEHIERCKINARAEHIGISYRVTYKIPDPKPLVSIIIPTRNQYDLLKQCIDSILNKSDYTNYEIIIVDNGSDENQILRYFDDISKNDYIRIMRDDDPFNYSRLNNHAVKQANGSIIGLLNNDIEVISPGWLTELVSMACRDGIGAVGARLLYPDGRLQHGGVILGVGGVAGHSHRYLDAKLPGYFGRAMLIQSLSAVTGACLFTKKRLYEEVSGLNEENLSIAFNDIDFCLKLIEKGYKNIWTPYAELFHHESASRGLEDTPEKIARFNKEVDFMKKRWQKIIDKDPAYSPNLTVNVEDFSLAFPPRI